MQIAITKKLAAAIGIKPASTSEPTNPLFCWTANWTNTFDRRKEDMVVMVNHATRFTVIIFGVKRNHFKDIAAKMTAAIRNTLLALNVNSEIVEEYMRLSGEILFTANHDRKLTAWVNWQGLDAAFVVGRAVNGREGEIKYVDTLGNFVSDRIVNCGKSAEEAFVPRRKMLAALSEATGKPAYRYRAFELLVTLDLDIYKAVRRLIVPADITLSQLHQVLQEVFHWKNYHLYDFTVFAGKSRKPVIRLVESVEDLEYDKDAILMTGRKLSEYMPLNKRIFYTYDLGDNWEHEIKFLREIAEHNEESPYLLEAIGQTPPEDVGGVGGYCEFREIMLDPNHPEHAGTKEWAGYWSLELREWEKRPRVIKPGFR